MIHDKSVNYFASLSIHVWANQGQDVRAKQIEAPTLEYAQEKREASPLEKVVRLEVSAPQQQQQSLRAITKC